MTIQRAVLYGTVSSEVQIRNMFTCDVVESGGDTSAILWGAYMSSMVDAVVECVANIVNFYQYDVQEFVNGSWETIDSVTIDDDGTWTSDPVPNAVALVLIGVAVGLRKIGRKFIGVLTETALTGNIITGSEIANAAAALAAYITPFTGIGGGTITPGIVDKNGDFHPFVSGFVSSLLGSMRRRKPGSGI